MAIRGQSLREDRRRQRSCAGALITAADKPTAQAPPLPGAVLDWVSCHRPKDTARETPAVTGCGSSWGGGEEGQAWGTQGDGEGHSRLRGEGTRGWVWCPLDTAGEGPGARLPLVAEPRALGQSPLGPI